MFYNNHIKTTINWGNYMKFLYGMIVKFYFISENKDVNQETFFAVGENHEQLLNAIHKRIIIGYTLKIRKGENTLILRNEDSGETTTVEIGSIQILPILECQLEPMYISLTNATYVHAEKSQTDSKLFKNISKYGFYKKLSEQLDELQTLIENLQK